MSFLFLYFLLQTPAKFKWSIDEMANLLPVEIDPEDIRRQAVFLSQARYELLLVCLSVFFLQL